MYLRCSLVVGEITVGMLTPSTITTSYLRKLLVDISTHLPRTVQLPGDPSKEFWLFYPTLHNTAVICDHTILVIMNISLLDINVRYEVNITHNLPVPSFGGNLQKNELSNMVAQYQLVANTLHTQFVLLTSEELGVCTCTKPKTVYCSIL